MFDMFDIFDIFDIGGGYIGGGLIPGCMGNMCGGIPGIIPTRENIMICSNESVIV
jgi:hypothetical protein